MKTTWLVVLSAGLVAGSVAYRSAWAAPDSTAPAGVADGSASALAAAPDFKIKDAFGKEFTLARFKGKIVVLE